MTMLERFKSGSGKVAHTGRWLGITFLSFLASVKYETRHGAYICFILGCIPLYAIFLRFQLLL